MLDFSIITYIPTDNRRKSFCRFSSFNGIYPFSFAELCVRYDMSCTVLESTTNVSTPS